MSRASRPAHSQCSAIGQNCRCRLVFEFSYFLYSIFHFLDILLNPYIILLCASHTIKENIASYRHHIDCTHIYDMVRGHIPTYKWYFYPTFDSAARLG